MPESQQTSWTLRQLCSLAASEMSRRGAHAFGREMPLQLSVRNVRYYIYLGLMDRPLGYHEGAARFGSRHLVQLLAVRALQSRGLPLAEIQRQLQGNNILELALVAESVLSSASTRRGWDGAAPRPHLPLLHEDRETFMDWLQLSPRTNLRAELEVCPRHSLN